MSFDAVFFDFGGVVLASPFEAFTSYECRVGLPPDAIRTINATNPDDNAWAHFERSAIGLDEFTRRFEAEALALGFRVDATEVLACLDGEVREPMVDLVRRCRDRATTALLTNNVVFIAINGLVGLATPPKPSSSTTSASTSSRLGQCG